MLLRVPVLAFATVALVSPAAAQSWGWGCGCGAPVVAPVAPVIAAAPVVAAAPLVVVPNLRRPIYVVNQGPVHAGPDITVVPSLRVEGPYQPYPYIRTFGRYGGYVVKQTYARRYGVYRYHGAPARHIPGHITQVALLPPQ